MRMWWGAGEGTVFGGMERGNRVLEVGQGVGGGWGV